MLDAIAQVRPLEGDYYTLVIDGEKVRARCLANYRKITLFEDVHGWKFCLTEWEVRRYTL